MARKTTPDLINRAFHDWLFGMTLRPLGVKYGFNHGTLSYQFRKNFGDNYSKIKKMKGVVGILKEYLTDRSISAKAKAEVKGFLNSNIEMLVEIDKANADKTLYTNKDIRLLCRKEVSKGNDYRADLFDALLDGDTRELIKNPKVNTKNYDFD